MIPGDLRLRIVAAFVLVIVTTQLANPASVIVALVFALALTFSARPDRHLWRRLVHVEGFVALLLCTLPFTIPGEPLFSIGPLSASAEGLARALLVAGKVTASVLLVLTFLGTVEPMRLGAALHSLRVPEPIVRLLVLTLRYLSLIRDEARRLLDAMRMRGFRPRTNRHTWRSYGNLVGMLLVRALERAQRIEEAMRCRGFAGRFPFATLGSPPRADWVSFSAMLAVALAGMAWDRI